MASTRNQNKAAEVKGDIVGRMLGFLVERIDKQAPLQTQHRDPRSSRGSYRGLCIPPEGLPGATMNLDEKKKILIFTNLSE